MSWKNPETTLGGESRLVFLEPNTAHLPLPSTCILSGQQGLLLLWLFPQAPFLLLSFPLHSPYLPSLPSFLLPISSPTLSSPLFSSCPPSYAFLLSSPPLFSAFFYSLPPVFFPLTPFLLLSSPHLSQGLSFFSKDSSLCLLFSSLTTITHPTGM